MLANGATNISVLAKCSTEQTHFFQTYHAKVRSTHLSRRDFAGAFSASKDGARAFMTAYHRLDSLRDSLRALRAPREFDRRGPSKRVLFDVGANKGLELSTMLQLWGKLHVRQTVGVHAQLCNRSASGSLCDFPPVEAHAFELSEDTALMLKKTARKLQFGADVHIHHMGVSDVSGSAMVCEDPERAGSGFERVTLAPGLNGTAAGCQRVALTSLDDFTASRGIGVIHYAKVDAEGFDGRVLLGAQRLLRERRLEVLVFECCHLWPSANLPARAFDDVVTPSTTNGRTTRTRGRTTPGTLYSAITFAASLGYDTYLLGERNLLWITPLLHSEAEISYHFERCGWCNFAFVNATAELRQLPKWLNQDVELAECLSLDTRP